MYLLYDIGGTKMRIARTDTGRAFLGEPVVIPTPRTYDEGFAEAVKAGEHLAAGARIDGVAVGIAGVLARDRRSLVGSPNLTDWVGRPLATHFEDVFKTTVTFANDAALVGLGEMHHGAGVVDGVGAYLTISTGVGGARFVDGRIDETTFGFEVGKQIIDADQSICPECSSPFLEDYISGKATEERCGVKAYTITDVQMWQDYAKLLACGVANTAVHWSPERIVLGGSMMVGTQGPTIDIAAVHTHLAELLTIYPETPELQLAALGDCGGLYGAMVVCRDVV